MTKFHGCTILTPRELYNLVKDHVVNEEKIHIFAGTCDGGDLMSRIVPTKCIRHTKGVIIHGEEPVSGTTRRVCTRGELGSVLLDPPSVPNQKPCYVASEVRVKVKKVKKDR